MTFEKILVANRGEIAVRIIRACRELGIGAVAVYSEADAQALHVRLANQAYLIGPAPAAESYLKVEAIVAAARASGAGAIHPGYGFLSEKAELARACVEAGIVFIGPPAEAITLMGSKIAAKRLAIAAGVPVVPGYEGDDQSDERLLAEAARLGYPLLIKASAGGGGKGMRTVRRPEEFQPALEGARREALAAFGDSAVLLERLIERPRHIEIQVLADHHGAALHLGERECSIQRRHQKIVEESPSPALTPELREEMGAAALRVAASAGYRNAGTIEFMLDEQGGYYFLEMNTRLQVEHPVTEGVSGLDLVHLQIAIAAGQPLPLRQEQLQLRGHAIEARLYAEDPRSYLPAIGQIALFTPPEGPGVRLDAGVASGDHVTVHYDPMLAKLIVSAADRPSAIARLRQALHDFTVLGLTTNLPLLRAIVQHPAFVAGETHTGFLEQHALARELEPPVEPPAQALIGAACYQLAQAGLSAQAGDPWESRGWRAGRAVRTLRYQTGNSEHSILGYQSPDNRWSLRYADRRFEVELVRLSGHMLTLRLGSTLEQVYVVERGAELLVGYHGQQYHLRRTGPPELDQWSHAHARGGDESLRAPMPGTIVKLLVEPGQQVAASQPLLVMEAMKMEHTIVAPHAGVVRSINCQTGALVSGDALLVELDPLPPLETAG